MDMNNYNKLVSYVKRNRLNSTFDANVLRDKLNVTPKEFTSIISKALNTKIMRKIGSVPSAVPSHRGRAVGVYTRTENSYVNPPVLVGMVS